MFAKNWYISTAIFVVALSILGIVVFKAYKQQNLHEVVLIVGTSSAGKTSIINELMKMVDKRYKVVSIDDFDADGNIKKVLEQQAKSLGWDDKKSTLDDFMDGYVMSKSGNYMGIDTVLSTGPKHDIQKQITHATYAAFFEYARQKNQKDNIIIDTVFDSFDNYNQFIDIFRDNKKIKILVYCSLDIIQERVEKRNLTGKPEEQRTTWQVFPQFAALYKVKDSPHEQIVDKVFSNHILQPLKTAIDGLIKQLEQTKLENDIMKAKLQIAMGDVHNFNNEFIKKFKLNEQKEIVISPIQSYDLILNSGTQEPLKNAQEIESFLQANRGI